MSQPTSDGLSLPPGFVARAEAVRISGIGVTAWQRWEAEGKVTCGQWFTRPGGGRLRIYSTEGIEQMMRAADLSFPPPGTVDRQEAARMLGLPERTFSTWERQGRIPRGRLVSIPGKPAQRSVYPVEELRRLAEDFKREAEEATRRLEPYPDPDRPGVLRVPVASDKHEGLEALIDADALPLVRGKRWNWSGGRAGGSGASVVIPGGSSLARLITGVADDPALLVSHRNGDRLDCRRENLIVRTRSESRRAAKRSRKWEAFQPYPDPDRPGVIRVPLCTNKHKGMEALIDAADLPLVQGKQWNWSPGSSAASAAASAAATATATAGSVVLRVNGTPKPTLARILLGIEDPEQLVCHLNGDRLDCRRANLVVRTRSQVSRHKRKVLVKAGVTSSSRFKGVTRTESGRKWAAAILVNGKSRNLGRFRSEIDAALAYDAALRELMGADARVNLPDAAEVERLRALEPVIETNLTWPPPGMVDRHEACRMFGVSPATWKAWENKGRITCGRYHPLPDDKPGRCKLYPKDELERARVEIEKFGKPYPDPDRPGVWRVPLKGYLTYREALIDEADLPIVEGRNWNWTDRTEGVAEGNVILATMGGGHAPLHRMIASVTDPKTRVSFANGNALDCRRGNLLVRTLAETTQASRKRGSVSGRKCSSPFKGISWAAKRGLWIAQIRVEQVHLHIGRFDGELEAARAYDAAARALFGEHAYLNFPDQPSSEQAMAAARRALDSGANRKRAARRRQRDLERELRRAAAEAAPAAARPPAEGTPMLSPRVARQLFDVTRPVWRRWRRLGWLPPRAAVGERRMYPLPDVERLLLRCGVVAVPYPDPQRPGVYRVPLAGETAQGREALIDADAVPLVQTMRWRFAPTDSGRGGEVQTMDPAENLRLHYVVMGLAGNAQEYHIGHRNDDPLDCRRANLVVRTLTDTAANKRKQATFCGRPCTSRFKGVCRPERAKLWLATIKKDRVSRRLGTFHDEIAAAQAYDEAARELFGEHARLNFPDGVDPWLEREAFAAEAAEAAEAAGSPPTREVA